jgi:pimeloyl-[acyl-carrier protein] methyl ester esterase
MRDLLLLHGWGMNSAVWSPLQQRLATSHRLHLARLPGHDGQAYAGETRLSEWAEAVLRQAPQQAIWLGWSLGGQVALQAALQAPDRVQAVLLSASTPRFSCGPDWPNAMPAGTLSSFAVSLQQDYRGTIGRFLALQVRGSEQSRQVLRELKADLASRAEADANALEAGLGLLRETDLRARLGALRCPHAWCFGERDSLIPSGTAKALASISADAQITVIAGAGHAPFLSHADEWLSWLAEVAR